MSGLQVKFWGVRGSVPVPGPSTIKYGGNTACIELYSDKNDNIIFDAGTGIRSLGATLDFSKKNKLHVLISHPHWDHINGLPFFSGIYVPGNKVSIYGPRTHEHSLQEIINGQMQYSYFPIRTAELLAKVDYNELKDGDKIKIGNFNIATKKLNHPVDCLGYKVKYKDKIFIYLGDNEPYYNVYNDEDPGVKDIIEDMNRKLMEFVRGADLLVTDAQYIPSEYGQKKGWGHSTTHHVVNMAVKAEVKKVIFFHHEPLRSDSELDEIVQHYKLKIEEKGLNLIVNAAIEGETLEV